MRSCSGGRGWVQMRTHTPCAPVPRIVNTGGIPSRNVRQILIAHLRPFGSFAPFWFSPDCLVFAFVFLFVPDFRDFVFHQGFVMRRFGSTVDFLSMSFKPDFSGLIAGYTPVDFVDFLRFVFEQSGLNGVSFSPRAAGLFSYRNSANVLRPSQISDDSLVQSGLIAYTPFSESFRTSGVFFSLSSMGCIGVDFSKLISLLSPFHEISNITRLDLAVDYFDGLVTVEMIQDLYQQQAFLTRGVSPRCSPFFPQRIGIDGNLSKVAGYTFYVGKRGGAKHFRVYEKGLQLAAAELDSPYPDWTRLEIEFRDSGCTIPFDWYKDFDAFLVGAYPKLFEQLPSPSHLKNYSQLRTVLKQDFSSPAFQCSLTHLIHYCKVSYGALFNVLKHKLGYSDEKIVNFFLPDDESKIPARLSLPQISSDFLDNQLVFSH